MLTKSRAIVLHHVKYGESSLVITLYTEKFGRISCIVNGVRSKKTKFPVTYFQPLTLLDTELYFKPNRDLHRLKEISCPFHYVSIPFTLAKSSIALFLGEILYKTLREEEGNPPLFEFLIHAFRLFDTLDAGISDFHVRFLLHYAGYLGFSLADIGHPEDITRFSDLHIFRDIPGESLSALVYRIKAPLGDSGGPALNNKSRALLLDCIVKYYQEHFEDMGKIRSLSVLREIFREVP